MTALLWIAWSILVLGGTLSAATLVAQTAKPRNQRNTGMYATGLVINLFVVTVFFLGLINR